MTSIRRPQKFRFKRNSNVGAADAADDQFYLAQSFVDTGDLDIALDTSNPSCIVLGRTGSGKTALLNRLRDTAERVIVIEPDSLSLGYVSNSSVLRHFAQSGVNLDLFYRFLWRHIFAVEIIRKHYNITSSDAQQKFSRSIFERLAGNQTKRKALDYLRSWGEQFWVETEHRIKEITQRVERELENATRASMGVKITPLEVGASGSSASSTKLTEEQKITVTDHAQRVVESLQIAQLDQVVKLIDEEILTDSQKPIYITIDRLDENWVNDELRYDLIRSLLETIRRLNSSVRHLKVLVAVREDLLYRVFKYSKQAGYQEEKYRAAYLHLKWSDEDLITMLGRRVDQLVEQQYTSQPVSLRDLLPKKLARGRAKELVDPLHYMIQRTMRRPRDLIVYFNECIRQAADEPVISKAAFLAAEEGYSRSRVTALVDEWRSDYPHLRELLGILRGYPAVFVLRDQVKRISADLIGFLGSVTKDYEFEPVLSMSEAFERSDEEGLVHPALEVLYRVGAVGLSQASGFPIQWSWRDVPYARPDLDGKVAIHPAFWAYLGIKDGDQEG